ncbi:MAG: hypothetical protein IPP26_01395 [Flavobacteriales bacterium]|nr:hypothetical protein [Flavobacteriales bacterium]
MLLRPLGLFALVLLSTSISAQGPDLVGYWHNWNDASAPYIELDQVDPRYTVIEVSFAEPAPGTTYNMQFSPAQTAPAIFIAQVASLQAQGKKVLISIGGANATVQLNADVERDQFVSSVLGILNAYGFDGIDIDLEGASVGNSGGTIAAPTTPSIIRLIDAVEAIMVQYRAQHNRKLFLTMAPETAYVQGGMSAYGGIWGAYLPIIDALRDSLDILQVQLYNSGSMYGLDGGIYTQGTADFIVSQTEAVIQGFTTAGGTFAGLRADQVAIGLPACVSAAGGGYVDTATVRAAADHLLGAGPQPGTYVLQQSGGYPDLRGLMTWSVNWDAAPSCNGANSFAETYERIFGSMATTITDQGATHLLPLYPNPARDRITMRLPSGCSSMRVVIQDLTGRIVTDTWSMGLVDVSHLSNGFHVLTCPALGFRANFIKE